MVLLNRDELKSLAHNYERIPITPLTLHGLRYSV